MKRLFAIALLLVSSTAIADWQLISTGTAFVVNKDYALTAAHVLEDCDGVSIRHKHKEIDAEVVALDVINDLGLLLLEKPFEQTANFRGGKAIRLGDTVVNYGYPLFGELSDFAKISRGEINSLAGWGNDSRHIQYDAPTQPGNSGGPVLDLSGNVVGIVSSGLSQRYAQETGHIAQNVNFAVKSFVAEAFLSSNGADYEKANSIEEMKTADIAEKAETFTVLVACWGESDKPAQTASAAEETTDPEIEGSSCIAKTYTGEDIAGVWVSFQVDEATVLICQIAKASSTTTEPDQEVTVEKSEGDTCPDGQIQTYKGCEDSAEVATDRAAKLAEAKARALAIAEAGGAGTKTNTGTGTGKEAMCKVAVSKANTALAAKLKAREDYRAGIITSSQRVIMSNNYLNAKYACFNACPECNKTGYCDCPWD